MYNDSSDAGELRSVTLGTAVLSRWSGPAPILCLVLGTNCCNYSVNNINIKININEDINIFSTRILMEVILSIPEIFFFEE